MKTPEKTPDWNAAEYQDSYSYVWQYGSGLISQLAPQPGERVLDLGCGTGQLAAEIAERGAVVMGLDSDRAMIATAQNNYPVLNFPNLTFSVADAASFQLEEPVDAVFSNAALHWVTNAEAAARCIYAALNPGGRFVAEFGGKGNVQTILTSLSEVSGKKDLNPWYFPSIGEYATLLETVGFEVVFSQLFDRPTPLNESGLAGWLDMFGQRFFPELSSEDWAQLVTQVEKRVPQLCEKGEWIADYRRLRVVAIKPVLPSVL